MPAPADRRRPKRRMWNTRLDQAEGLETIRRARETRAEARRVIEQARQGRETTVTIIAGVPARSGVSYEAWDRKVRQEAGTKKSR
jgi:hypothetical protein